MKIILLATLFVVALTNTNHALAKDVRVSMRGHWNDTSLVAEACEAVAELAGDSSSEAFWKCESFVPSVTGLPPYKMAKDTLAALVPEVALPVASVGLHARRFSPLIAAQFNLMEQDVHTGTRKPSIAVKDTLQYCDSPALFAGDGTYVCGATVSDAKHLIEQFWQSKSSKQIETTSTDKLSPPDASTFSFAIYGILGYDSTHRLIEAFKKGTVVNSGEEIPFVFRHHTGSTNSPVRLPMQGYGVYLDVKNTEYKTTDEREDKMRKTGFVDASFLVEMPVVAGINLTTLSGRFDQLPFTNTRRRLAEIALKDIEVEEKAFKVPVWHMSRANMQIVDYVIGSASKGGATVSESNAALGRLADLTANFPLRMGAVLRAGDDTAREDRIVESLRKLWESVSPGTCAINVNGHQLREEQQDFFHVLDLFASQEKHLLGLAEALEQQPDGSRLSLAGQSQLPEMMHHLGGCNLAKGDSGKRSGHQSSAEISSGPRYWIDRDLVQWVNDVEKDRMYQRLRPSYSEILRTGPYYQPLFPRKNLFNLIYIMDAADSDTAAAFRGAYNYLSQGFAARFGFLFVDSNNLNAFADGGKVSQVPRTLSTAMMAAFFVASSANSLQEFLPTLVSYGAISDESIESALTATLRQFNSRGEENVFETDIAKILANKTFIAHYNKVQCHAFNLGLRKFPLAVFNGLLFTSLDRVLFNGFDSDFEIARDWVRTNTLTDDVRDVYTWMMQKHNAVKRFQGLLNDPAYLRIPAVPNLTAVLSNAPYLYAATYSLEAVLETNVLYVSNSMNEVEWSLLHRFVSHIYKCGDNCVRMRYTIVFVGKQDETSVFAEFVADVLTQLANTREERRITALFNTLSALDASKYNLYSRSELIEIAKKASAGVLKFTANSYANPNAQFVSSSKFIKSLGPLPLVMSNGRVVALDSTFLEEDFVSLFDAELSKVGSIGDCFERGNVHNLYRGLVDADDVGSEFVATKLASVASVILAQQSVNPPQAPLRLSLDAITVRYGPRDESYRHTIEAVIDPTKREGQRLVALIHAIAQQVKSASIVIYLNPPNGLSDVSMTTFYRFVFDSSFTVINPDFSSELRVPIAHFVNLPSNIVFTMGVDEPEGWMVFADVAEADLDNIKLADTTPTVVAEYGLHSILITGKCVDVDRQTAPKSLPLVLQPSKIEDRYAADTTVMSNFAYFQLRSQFGQWRVGIQPGENAKRYKVMDVIETEANVYRRAITKLRPESMRRNNLMVSSFSGAFVHLQVREISPLSGEGKAHEAREASRAARALSLNTESGKDSPTLNVFSVASGHLYERFLRMMFHTVVKTSREARDAEGKPTRVKFWLIENFLSPRFKKFLPQYAKEQGFEYQFISYHWPHWLRRQSQKQRTIWAYKILFLDVLFPLNLEKVIFVDADQIVRSDLHELYNMDLEGKPMAYTPFCRKNMNPDTKGFRFWDQGFWVDHLRGLPYHISAIYVVDLKRLRAMSGGDHYRMVYEQLSADPNSLANLDQDLPNYVQHQVPIFSLPEEWLWCETWCNGESKSSAKTIDLCNNPQTKIPKLENAKRIIPEWTALDDSLGSF